MQRFTIKLMLSCVVALLLLPSSAAATTWLDPSIPASDRLLQYRMWAEKAETRMAQTYGTAQPGINEVSSATGKSVPRVAEATVVKTQGIKGAGVASGGAAKMVGGSAGPLIAMSATSLVLEQTIGTVSYWHADGTQCSNPLGTSGDPLCNVEHYAYFEGGPWREEGWADEEPPLLAGFELDAMELVYPEVHTLLDSYDGDSVVAPPYSNESPQYTLGFTGGQIGWTDSEILTSIIHTVASIAHGSTKYQWVMLDETEAVATWVYTVHANGTKNEAFDTSTDVYLLRMSDGTRSPSPMTTLYYQRLDLNDVVEHVGFNFGVDGEANSKWLYGHSDEPGVYFEEPTEPIEGGPEEQVAPAPIAYPSGGSMNRSFVLPSDANLDGTETPEDVATLYDPSPLPEPVQDAVGAPNPDPNEGVRPRQDKAEVMWIASQKWPFAGASFFFDPGSGACNPDSMAWDLDLPVLSAGGQPSRPDHTVSIEPIVWAEPIGPYRWVFTSALAIGWVLGMMLILRPRINV